MQEPRHIAEKRKEKEKKNIGGCVTLTRSRAAAAEGKAPGCGGVWWSVCWVESGLKEYAPQEKKRKKHPAKKYTKNRKKECINIQNVHKRQKNPRGNT